MDFSNPLKIIVKTNAGQNKIKGFDEDRKAWKVDIKAIPEKGKANQEIIRFFDRLSGKKTRIITGSKSKRKTLAFD